MWKATFIFSDHSKLTVKGKGTITFSNALRCWKDYGGMHSEQSTYQQYPKKDHPEVCFRKKLKEVWDSKAAGMEYADYMKRYRKGECLCTTI